MPGGAPDDRPRGGRVTCRPSGVDHLRALLGAAQPGPRPSKRHGGADGQDPALDRKSTRLNSSHVKISYAVFCLKKKKQIPTPKSKHTTINIKYVNVN